MITVADVDWGFLRGSVVTFVVAVGISVSLVLGTYYFSHEMQSLNSKQQARLATVRAQYQSLDELKHIIASYLPQYEAMWETGLIGPENRLNWIETLRDAAARIELPSLSYSIASRTKYIPTFPFEKEEGFNVYASNMILNMGLLHEADLPALLQELDDSARGLFSVRDCSLTRVADEFHRDPTRKNLNAVCGLMWFTVDMPDQRAASG